MEESVVCTVILPSISHFTKVSINIPGEEVHEVSLIFESFNL